MNDIRAYSQKQSSRVTISLSDEDLLMAYGESEEIIELYGEVQLLCELLETIAYCMLNDDQTYVDGFDFKHISSSTERIPHGAERYRASHIKHGDIVVDLYVGNKIFQEDRYE